VETPYPGIQTWKTDFGARIVRLHYEADPEKGLGEKVFIPELKKQLSPWAKAEYDRMTDKALFRQEYEIDFSARDGEKLFQLDDEATLEKSFPIPHEWTRYYGLDPHERKPHAHLWCAVDPYGDRWYYREFWPSKVYGKPGVVPEDDNRYTIKEHLEVVKYLESSENPANQKQDEFIYRRVIDYSARAMGKGTTDDKPQDNFQLRFEKTAREISLRMNFVDCKKDSTGIEAVNQGLKPLEVERDGKWVKRSRIHIFEDACPELTRQLRTVRFRQLTATQAAVKDPIEDEVEKRNDLTDLTRYIEMDKPRYIPRNLNVKSDWEPMTAGVAY
jgi:hypothetical protein